MSIQKTKSNDDLFIEYVKPSLDVFQRTICEYYDLTELSEIDLLNQLRIYFNHTCRFTKSFFLDAIQNFKEARHTNEYVLTMLTDFAEHFLSKKEAALISLNSTYYLFAESGNEIEILKSNNFKDVEQEIETRGLLTVYEI